MCSNVSKKTMTKKIRNIAVIAALSVSVSLPAEVAPLNVRDIQVNVDENTRTLGVTIDLNLKDFKVGRSGEVVFTPVVYSADGNDSVAMQPVTVCGRSRYYYHMRLGELDHGTPRIYRAGSTQTVRIDDSVTLEPWMLDDATVELRRVGETCCTAPKVIAGDSSHDNVLLAYIRNPKPELKCDYVFAPPMEQEPVEKSYEGSAFVTFVVNRTELNPTYMNNPAELKKITGTIDVVKSDPDAIITEVHIHGYASPEGSYANNTRLAQGRTQTLSDYVNSLYNFEKRIMTTSFTPEDWGGLRAYVQDSLYLGLENRGALLDIIDGSLDYDARDAALKKRFPRDYQILLTKVYPWLRHSDYAVKYQIKVYTDLENLNRLYHDDPTKLRPVDFYTIAQQYAVGSPQYIAVMKKAVDVYPDHKMINLNVANIYMMEGNLDAAQSCLLKAGQGPLADYARGVLAAKRDDFDEAGKWFKKALDGGIEPAAKCLSDLEKINDVKRVEIMVPTEVR